MERNLPSRTAQNHEHFPIPHVALESAQDIDPNFVPPPEQAAKPTNTLEPHVAHIGLVIGSGPIAKGTEIAKRDAGGATRVAFGVARGDL